MARFAKPANYQIAPPLEGVKPTLFKTTLRVSGLLSAVAKYWDLDMDNHTFSEMDEPNDQDLVIFMRSAGSTSNFTDTLSTGIIPTITDGGKVTFSTPLDSEKYNISLIKTVKGLDSLKEIVVRIPQIYPYVDNANKVKPTVSLEVSDDGITYSTRFAGVKCDLTSPTFAVSRYWFAGKAAVRVTVDFGEYLGSTGVVYIPHAFTPVYAFSDWMNEAETMATWAAAGIGLLAGAATGIGVDQLKERMAKTSAIKQIALFAGQSVLITIEAILGALAYCIHKGWATWSDLTIDNIAKGAQMGVNLLGLGAAGASFALDSLIGGGRTGDIISSLGAGVQGVGAAVAYLTVFSTCKRYVYC